MAAKVGQSKGKHKQTCANCQVAQKRKSHRYCDKCHNAYMREWRKTHPVSEEQRIKGIVRNKTKMRIQRGLLIPYPCEICDSLKVEAHHDDYRKPYCVRWLCREHHLEYHNNNQKDRSL